MKKNDFVLKKIVKILFPILLVYVGYIQFYGEESPGGGFQSGLVLTYLFVLYKVFFNHNKKIKVSFFLKIAAYGVLLYFFTGFISIFYGGFFLDYLYFSKNNVISRHIGVFIVELGVFLAVFSSMTSIFLIFYDFFKENTNE